MKILTRLLTAPLAMIVWLCAGLLYLSAPLFGLASAVLTVLTVVVILAGSLINGIIAFFSAPKHRDFLAEFGKKQLLYIRDILFSRYDGHRDPAV